MLKIFAGTVIANFLIIIFLVTAVAGGFEEDPGPEELPVEQSESVIDEPEVESEPVVESEPALEPEVTADVGIMDTSGNIVIWSQGNVTYAGDTGNIYVRYGS
tara:strand:+ start:345 stop:653 length:309 start_codon:yes stop_codon:yes gene_type:complete